MALFFQLLTVFNFILLLYFYVSIKPYFLSKINKVSFLLFILYSHFSYTIFIKIFLLLTTRTKKNIIIYAKILKVISRGRYHMKKWLSSFSIQAIIFLSFIPLILLILMTYYGFYKIGSRQLESQTYQGAENISTQISSSLTQNLDNVYRAAQEVTSNWYFFQMKQNMKQNRTPAVTPNNYYRLYQLLDNLIVSNPDYFSSISLFLDNRSIVVYLDEGPETVRTISFSYEDFSSWVSSDTLTWVLPREMHPYRVDSKTYSSLGLMMLLGDPFSDVHGFILFEINDELLLSQFRNAVITPGSRFAITKEQELLLTNNLVWTESLSRQMSGLPSQFYTEKDCCFYTPVTVPESQLTLGFLTLVPFDEISLNQKSLTRTLFVIVLLFFVICTVTYCFIYFAVSKPLIRLNRCLTKPYDVMAPTDFHISGSTEIQTITHTLEQFLERIRTLLQNLNHEMEERRIAELNILYAQINPHFLYNALDTIYQLCELNEIDDAKTMTHDLASFYRIGVSKGVSHITLEEECTHAKVYLSIMKLRFDDFTYQIDLPEDLKSCIIIKNVLQPIVENAIYHGIHPLADRSGRITISAVQQQEDIIITVADNGIGIPEDELADLKADLCKTFHPTEKGKLYGLKNVAHRIHLTYHSHYGLTIESRYDEGTRITITIPKVTKEDFSYEHENTVC